MKTQPQGVRFKEMCRKFSILNGWRISVLRKPPHAVVGINTKTRHAVMHTWENSVEEPDDFIFHEALHVAMRAYVALDRRRPKEAAEVEEELVRNICKIVRKGEWKQ